MKWIIFIALMSILLVSCSRETKEEQAEDEEYGERVRT